MSPERMPGGTVFEAAFAIKQSRIGEMHPEFTIEAAANSQGVVTGPGGKMVANGCFFASAHDASDSAFAGGGNLVNISPTLAY
jgi:hypothetical protein